MKPEKQNRVPTADTKSKRFKSKRIAKLGSAPNMQAAANRTGYAFEMLSEAKNLGCRAFTLRGSVDCDAFVEWLQSKEQAGFRDKWDKEGAIPTRETSKRVKDHYDAMEAKRRYDEKRLRLIPFTTVCDRLRTLATRQREIAEQHIKDPKAFADFCAAMQSLVDDWTQPINL